MSIMVKFLRELKEHVVSIDSYAINNYDDLENFRKIYLTDFFDKLLKVGGDSLGYSYFSDYKKSIEKVIKICEDKYLMYSEFYANEALERIKNEL